jgi:hypothetical protein
MAPPNDNASAHPADRYDAEVRKVIPFYDTIQSETLDLVRFIAGEPASTPGPARGRSSNGRWRHFHARGLYSPGTRA